MAYCPPATPVVKMPTVEKRVGAVLNYGFNLSPEIVVPTNPWAPPAPVPVPWLSPGEQVILLNVTAGLGSVSGTADLIVGLQTITANESGVPASLLTAWISGGIAGNIYIVTYAWTTNSSPVERQDDRTLRIVCIP
jgi:hypothetical protein